MTARQRRLQRLRSRPLTLREKEVWRQVALGRTSKQIGRKMSLSHRTVDTHRENLRLKLNVHSTAGLIAKWYQKAMK